MIYAGKKLNRNFLFEFQFPQEFEKESAIYNFLFLWLPFYIHKFILIVYKLYFFQPMKFDFSSRWAFKSCVYCDSLVEIFLRWSR